MASAFALGHSRRGSWRFSIKRFVLLVLCPFGNAAWPPAAVDKEAATCCHVDVLCTSLLPLLALSPADSAAAARMLCLRRRMGHRKLRPPFPLQPALGLPLPGPPGLPAGVGFLGK